jgi:hypothetical protein
MGNIRDRFTDSEWEIKQTGKCSYQVSYGVVTPTSRVGNVGYCEKPSLPDQELGYCQEHAFPDQADMIEMIMGCCPATVFYDEAGTAIVLADDNTWIARVNTIGNADTAYLSAEPLGNVISTETPYTVDDLDELEGFRPGWEC